MNPQRIILTPAIKSLLRNGRYGSKGKKQAEIYSMVTLKDLYYNKDTLTKDGVVRLICGFIDVVEAGGCGDYITVSNRDEDTDLHRCVLLEEIVQNYDLVGRNVSLRYWISDEKIDKDVAIEQHLKTIIGVVNADWDVCYSEITGFMVFEDRLIIGGHDLNVELRSNVGKYLILEITSHNEEI